MRKIIVVVIITILVLLTFKYCVDKNEDKIVLNESTALIQEQIKNVGKLVVTEGHFSQVFTYENSKKIGYTRFNSDKKAIVIINADVTISYNLADIKYEIDSINKKLLILDIPKEEIKINPDFEYYDIQPGFFNKFEAEDYNIIKKTVNDQLMKKIEASDLKSNAQNRLISELSKFFILTKSLGWTLQYNENPVEDLNQLNNLEVILD